jgi:hypothetical protein
MLSSSTDTLRVRYGFIVVIFSLVALSGSPAAGQGSAGSIIGQVTDQSGAVLPGVTVTATSPALQVPQITDVTNELGEYRLAPLPIGVYELAFDLSGFRPAQRQDVRLTVGFTAKIDVALGLATVAETVTVSGAAPVVDVAATSGSTLLTREMIDLTPTSRNGVMSLLTLAPGARTFLDVGGNQISENPNALAFGQGGAHWYTLEGVPSQTLSGRADGQGANWDYQTIDEARVQTLGTDAEFPTRGVQITAVVKSGGNDFHGGGSWAQTNQRLQSHNVDDNLKAQGIISGNRIEKQYDFGGDLGGRIIRNRLWFYGAARNRYQGFSVLNSFKPDGSPALEEGESTWHTEKVSFQATPSHRFIGFSQWARKPETNQFTELNSYESRMRKIVDFHYAKAEWEGVRGNSFIASFQFGTFKLDSKVPFNADGMVGRKDLVTQRISGESEVAGENDFSSRKYTKGAATWYKPNWFHGNHEFKAGFEYRAELNFRSIVARPPNYYLLFQDGVPFEVAFFNGPTFPRLSGNMIGTYLKDAWTIGRRLTLNAGLRFDRQDAFAPENCREAAAAPSDVIFPAACFDRVQLPIFNNFAPRLHAAYDLLGDGKTVIKGGWGRYYDMRHLNPDVLRVTRNGIAYGIFRWHDLDGDLDYDDGEVDRDLNGLDYVETSGRQFETQQPPAVTNPNEKQPQNDQFSLSLERELISNFSLRATGVYTRATNIYRIQNNLRPYESYNVPVTNTDPGEDGRVGTADDGGLFTYYEFPTSLRGQRFEELMPINDPKADQSYRSFEVAGIKRLANRWQFAASYSATKRTIPIFSSLAVTNFNSSNDAGNLTPNDEINRSNDTWDWDAKALGSYLFPADILVSANFEHRSGNVFGRQVQFRGGTTIPAIVLNAEPIGTRRTPSVNLLTLRFEKTFPVLNAHRLAVRLNVYNALNANSVLNLQRRAGAQFLRPQLIMLPRIAEVSASYTF